MDIFKWTLRILLTLVGLGVVAAILFPLLDNRKTNSPRSSCQANLKQIGLGFLQYIQDYDDQMPQVRASGGWANALQPYVKSTALFQCPSEPNQPVTAPNPSQTSYTDYYYNAQLQGRLRMRLGDLNRLILLGDGNDGEETTDASYAKTGISSAWRSSVDSPAYRHLEGTNYLFTDSHVKWMQASKLSDYERFQGYSFTPENTKRTKRER